MFILQEEKCLNVTDVINFSGTEKFGRCYCYNLSGHLAHWVSVSWLIQMVSLKFLKQFFLHAFERPAQLLSDSVLISIIGTKM